MTAILQAISGLPLEWLEIEDTEVTGNGLKSLIGKELEVLVLSRLKVTDADVRTLSEITVSYVYEIWGTSLSKSALIKIKNKMPRSCIVRVDPRYGDRTMLQPPGWGN